MAEQQKVFSPDNSIKITKWKVKDGYRVSAGQLILLYIDADGDPTVVKRLKSPRVGVVQRRLFKEGDVVPKGELLLELAECNHTTVIKDMCAECGADLRKTENGNTSEASVPMVHSVPELKVSHKLAQKLGQADTERLLSDKKLVLLVDLDQTLIHTTNDRVPNNLKDVYHFQLYGPNSPWYHTRLRPGTAHFLDKMSPYFELHICTFGARNYAHMIATFLDENGKLFSHRILSRDECLNITSKTDNLKSLFPCGDAMVCIIDDREDVWNMASNLIQVKPYHFFQHTGDINAPPGMSKHELDGKGIDFNDIKDKTKKEPSTEKNASESKGDFKEPSSTTANDTTPSGDRDKVDKASSLSCDDSDSDQLVEIEDPDDYLLYLEQILIKIHARFYEIYDRSNEIPDLKVLVPKIRSEILVDSCLVFSGLVPNHVKLEQSKAYLIARGMGATVTQDLDERTTHLVAVTAGTIKAISARKRGDIKIVTPDWLWCCAERWEHADERLFPLDPNKPSKMRQPPPHTLHSPEHSGADKGSNSDDELAMGGPSDDAFPSQRGLCFTNTELAEMNKDFDDFFDTGSSSHSETDKNESTENQVVKRPARKRKLTKEPSERIKPVSAQSEPINYRKESSGSEEEDDDDEGSSPTTTKMRRGDDMPSDLEPESQSGDSEGEREEDDGGEWHLMGAALEREFLGLED